MKSCVSLCALSVAVILNSAPARAQAVQPINFQGLTQSQNNATNLLLPLSQISPNNSTFWDANRNITWSVSNGSSKVPFLTPNSSNDPNVVTTQALSILDAPYTRPNLYQLADGFGSKLGAVYQSLATWSNTLPYDDKNKPNVTTKWSGVSQNVTNLIWFTGASVRNDNMAARQILGKGSYNNNDYSGVLNSVGALKNIYGNAYNYPSSGDKTSAVTSPNGLIYGQNSSGVGGMPINGAKFTASRNNPRPFEVLSANYDTWGQYIPTFYANNYNTGSKDYNSNWGYLIGDAEGNPGIDDQVDSSSYASGHAAYGVYGGVLLGMLVPQRFQEMITRGQENAVGRVVLGAHWATDVIGSRTLAYYEIAQELANNPAYLGTPVDNEKTPKGNEQGWSDQTVTVDNYTQLFYSAYNDMQTSLQAACGKSVKECAQGDTSRFSNIANDKAFYEATLTMGLPAVFTNNTSAVDFRRFSAETYNAGNLLLTRLPYLTADQRADVISTTQYMPAAGNFLDNGSSFGYFSRINLFAAGGGYGAFNDMTGDVSITMDHFKGGFYASDTWSNDIGGNKGFTLNGTGMMTFTGANTYAGPTIVNGGALIVDGSITSNVTVNNGGLLGGHGSFGGGVINAGGFISPGNSPGTITSNGNLTLQQGSTYLAEVDGQKADKIVVNGTTTVNNASLILNTAQPAYLAGRKFDILTATGGITGAFSGLTSAQSFSFLNPYLSYNGNSASVGYSFTPFSTVGRTINQRNVGNALTMGAFGPISGPGANILNALFYGSYQSAQSVMDTVGGAGLAGVQTTAMEVGQMASSTVSDQIAYWRSGETNDATGVTLHEGDGQDRSRSFVAYAPTNIGVTTKSPITAKGPVAGLSSPVPPARTYRAWGSMFGGGANFLSDAGRGTPSATAGYYGGLLGVDYQLTPNALVGVSLGGSSAGFSVGSLSTTGNLTGFHAGLYGSYTMGASYLALNETFSAYSNKTNRSAGGYSFLPHESLSANFGSTEFRTRLEGGHSLLMGGLKATPFVAAEIAAYNANGFSEKSSISYLSSLALKNNGQAINSLPTFIGLRLSNAYTLANGWRLAPIGSLAYVHEFFPQRQFTNILMSMPGQDFNVAGPRSTYNLVQTKLGAQLFLNRAFALYSDFQGEFSPMSQSYGGTAGMKYYW